MNKIIQPNGVYNFDVDFGTSPSVKAWCTMELAGKWGIFQVFNTGRTPLFCDKGYCTYGQKFDYYKWKHKCCS